MKYEIWNEHPEIEIDLLMTSSKTIFKLILRSNRQNHALEKCLNSPKPGTPTCKLDKCSSNSPAWEHFLLPRLSIWSIAREEGWGVEGSNWSARYYPGKCKVCHKSSCEEKAAVKRLLTLLSQSVRVSGKTGLGFCFCLFTSLCVYNRTVISPIQTSCVVDH